MEHQNFAKIVTKTKKKQIAFQLKADHPRTGYRDTFFAPVTLTSTQWPRYSEDVPAYQKWTLQFNAFKI